MKFVFLFLIYFFSNVRGIHRISGGTTTTIDEYPHAVSLLTNHGSGSYLHACGGTILTPSAILSAASCSYTDDTAHPVGWWRARVGSSFSNSGGTVYIISSITAHPDFSPLTLDNDIAVLATRFPMELQPNAAARLSGAAYIFTEHQVVTAIGWGDTSMMGEPSAQLRHVAIWVVDQQTCTNRYNEVDFNITNNMVCAGWLDVGLRGQCPGDSGSPILGSDGEVVGVHSWAQGCGAGRFPGINTRIAPYIRWIVATALAA